MVPVMRSLSAALDDRQETSLIEIVVCCVRQASSGESPVGRGPNRKVTSVWRSLCDQRSVVCFPPVQVLMWRVVVMLLDGGGTGKIGFGDVSSLTHWYCDVVEQLWLCATKRTYM